MSFEGFYQIIRKDGTYTELDVYDPEVDQFVVTGSNARWWRIVDETNGYDTEGSDTRRAETVEYGFVEGKGPKVSPLNRDEWHYDGT